MDGGRGRSAVAVLLVGVALLFAGRWTAMLLAERWWAAAVAPEQVPFLMRWHFLTLGLELGGVLLAGAWCVGHALWVVQGIGTVEVPRRVGDLEIREVVSGTLLRPGGVVVGLLLGVLLGAGAGDMTSQVALAWHGMPPTVADPALGLDLGVYLGQLPLWSAVLGWARRIVWITLVLAAGAHLLVGGIRGGRPGLAMTEAARRQAGLLTACVLLLAAFGEALGPLRVVAGLDTGPWSSLPPVIRWSASGAWMAAALTLGWWAFQPTPRRFLSATLLWGIPLVLGTLVAASAGPATAPPTTPGGTGGPAIGALRVVVRPLRSGGRVDEVGPGLWGRGILPVLVGDHPGARLLAAAPVRLPVGGAQVPVWLAVRSDSSGIALLAIADDRLGPGGNAESFREGDAVAYPGVVSWRSLAGAAVLPEAPDSIVLGSQHGIPIGGFWRRLVVAWGTQSRAAFEADSGRAALWWRRAPRDRARHLFPPAWWDEPRPFLREGRLTWVVDGWFIGAGAPSAPPIPWDGGVVRYARPGLIALIDAVAGDVRIYRRPDADPVARSWAEIGGSSILPAESLPAGLLERSPSERSVAVLAAGLAGLAELPRPSIGWRAEGAAPAIAIEPPAAGTAPERIAGIASGVAADGALLHRVPEGVAPFTPRVLAARWGRFATLERLEDSVRGAGGQLQAGEVRYEAGDDATLAVRVRWAISGTGVPTVAWVELAEGDRLGAARTPATALANLRGESAPVVPAPDLPDRMSEARRWAARADSALRAGDLEGFARAFAALKRVLGTP